MARGAPNGRAAVIGTLSATGAIAVAGIAFVVVQLESAVAYVVFAVLVLVAAALVVSAGYWLRRARSAPP
jgi:hypothetical protein